MMEEKHRHFIIHKPYGYLSQFIRRETNRKNKKLLGQLYDFPENVMSVGRLDEKSEGLLLLTTDGQVSYEVRSTKVEKEYYAQLDGAITQDAIQALKSGVEIGFDGKKYNTWPCKARPISDPGFPVRNPKVRDARHGPTSWVSITLREGKYKQVRKMTSAVGFPTLRLVRVRIGSLQIDSLKPGLVEEVSRTLLEEKGLVSNL